MEAAAHTCIKKRLRFWYVFRLMSMLVGVQGAASGALPRCLLLTLVMLDAVLLLLLELLGLPCAADV